MAVGMACSILILLWVQDEWSYDRDFKDAASLYRVLQKSISIDGHIFQETKTPIPVAAVLKEQYPEIIRSSKLMSYTIPMKKGDESIFETIAFIDDDFWKMFNIEFIRGDIKSAFTGPHSIVITDEMASKYFGNEDAVGKSFETSGYPVTVTGVVKGFPANSHFHFDFLAPFTNIMGPQMNEWTGWQGICFTYIQLKEGTDSKAVDNKIRDLVQRNVKTPDIKSYQPEIFLQNIRKIHLFSMGKYTYDVAGNGNITYVRILAIVAVFILLIACINFMNLATAQSSRRAKEIGMRKITGANKPKIMFQFLGEALLIVFTAHVIAMILVELLMPGFNSLTGKQLFVNYRSLVLYVSLLGVVIFCSLLSGSYPALYLSSLKPLNTINGVINKNPGKTGFRRAMVILQFSLSFLLIAGTLIVGNQLRYLQNKDLGLNVDNIGHFKFGYNIQGQTLKAELANNPDITSASIVTPDIFDIDGTAQSFDWEGNTNGGEFYFSAIYTDLDFAKTFQLELKEGRFFSADFPGDTTALIINEKAAQILGFKDPIGQVLTSNGVKYRIIGEIRDFHFKTLRVQIDPLIIMKLPPSAGGNCYVRMKSDNVFTTVDYVKTILKSHSTDYPLEFKFLDDEYNKLYRIEERIDRILGYSSFLAIIISCMGLIGLSLFMTELRTKEIGIRKVNGSRSGEIFILLSKEYLVLVLISILIASPLTWYLMNKWLHSYAFRTSINPWLFVEVGIIVLVIAILTVGFQSYKAARENPVEALRYE
jgi:putative ABC transport system permease protein